MGMGVCSVNSFARSNLALSMSIRQTTNCWLSWTTKKRSLMFVKVMVKIRMFGVVLVSQQWGRQYPACASEIMRHPCCIVANDKPQLGSICPCTIVEDKDGHVWRAYARQISETLQDYHARGSSHFWCLTNLSWSCWVRQPNSCLKDSAALFARTSRIWKLPCELIYNPHCIHQENMSRLAKYMQVAFLL